MRRRTLVGIVRLEKEVRSMFLTRPIRARAFAALILLLGGIALFALIEGLVYSGDEEHVAQVCLAIGLVALS